MAAEVSGVGVGVGLGVAAAEGLAAGFAASCAYTFALATSDSRNALSEANLLTIRTESAFTATATRNPSINTIMCVRRLYHPDTRSIELLYQSSIFARARATSPAAASINVVNAFRT